MRRLTQFYAIVILILSLGGCTRTVYVDRVVEVKVPVSAPCMGERPAPVTPLRDLFTKEEWQALTTDQRDALVGAQALAHQILGQRATVASAGCK